MSVKVLFLVASTAWGIFLGPRAFATKPTVPIKSKEIRSRIEALRYSPNDDAASITEKLEKNSSRDCDSYGYDKADYDLMVSAIFETFPIAKLEEFLGRHRAICPRNANAAIAVIEQIGDQQRAKEAAVVYLTAFEDFDKYRWSSFMWSFIPMMRRIGAPCAKKEVEAIRNIYCGYSKRERGNENSRASLEPFQKACPNSKMECR